MTIATNMAGRGVDIKLGGELAEEVIAAVNRVLGRAGYENPFDMTQEERREALKRLILRTIVFTMPRSNSSLDILRIWSA